MKGTGACNNRNNLNLDNILNDNKINNYQNKSLDDFIKLENTNVNKKDLILPSKVQEIIPENSTLLSLYIGGSYAYGTNNENSDVDTRGIYKFPSKDILGLIPELTNIELSIDKIDPDITLHELKKTILLLAKNNPAMLEMLYIKPYYQDETMSLLYDNRKKFITIKVFDRFLGYVSESIKKAQNQSGGSRGVNHYKRDKYYLHIYRLLQQGKQLALYQEMDVKIDNVKELRELSKLPVKEQMPYIEKELKEFKKIEETSKLPDTIDSNFLNNLFLEIQTS